jgi:hypothetical protein
MKKIETLRYLNWIFGPDSTFCDLSEHLGEVSLERLVKNYEYIYNPYGLYDKLFEKKREKGIKGIEIEELEFLCHLSLFWNVVTLEFLNFFIGINRLPGLSDKEKTILIELSVVGSIIESELWERMKKKKIRIGRKENFHRLVKDLERKGYLNKRRYSRKEAREIKKRYPQQKIEHIESSYGLVLSLNYQKIMKTIYPDEKTDIGQGREEPKLEEMIMGSRAINVTKQIENLKRLL